MGLDTDDFNRKLGRVEEKTKKFSDKFGSLIKSGVKIASVAISAFAVKGIKDLVDFDKKINEVFTLLPNASKESMGKMTDDVRRLATTMGVDLTDAVNGLYQAISAGIDPDNAVTFLEDASKTAIAGVSSLEDAVGALTTIINGYGMEAKDTTKVSDVLFSVVKNGVTTMTELGQNIGKVTPIASALGIQIDEVGAMVATLTKQMGAGKTAEALTALKTMLAELAKSGMKASNNFKELSGVSFPEFVRQGGSVQEALLMMKEHAEANDQSLVDMFGSIEAGNGALMLVTNSGKELSKNLQKIQGDAGATEEAFQRLNDTTSQRFKKIMATFKEVGMKFAESFLPIIEKHLPSFTQGLMNSVPTLKKIGDAVVKFTQSVIELAPLIAKVVIGMTAFTAGSKASAIASSALGKSVKSLALPFTALFLGFETGKLLGDALAFTWKTLTTTTEDLKKSVDQKILQGINKESQELAKNIMTLDEKILAMKKSLGLIENLDPFEKIQKLSLGEQVKQLESMVGEAKRFQESGKRIKEDREKQLEIEKDILQEMISQDANAVEIAKQSQKVIGIRNDIKKAELQILKGMEDQEKTELKLIDATSKRGDEIRANAKAFADADAKRNKALAQALFLEEDISRAVLQTQKDFVLQNTALGKIQITQQAILDLEARKKKLIGDARDARSLEKGEADLLAQTEQDILNKRQDLRNLLKDEIVKLRNDELQIMRDQVAEVEKLLQDEKDRADEAKKNKDAKLAEVDALRAELKVAEEALEPLKKFFQKDFKGKITPNYAEMHREFKKLKEEGKLPPNVETLRDFREMLTNQASSQKLARDAIIEKGKIALADATALAEEEASHIENKKSLEAQIIEQKETILEAEKAHEKIINEERKKGLGEIRKELEKFEDFFNKLGDVDLTLNTDQKGHLQNIENLMGDLVGKDPSDLDLSTTEGHLYSINRTLSGKFVNQ